ADDVEVDAVDQAVAGRRLDQVALGVRRQDRALAGVVAEVLLGRVVAGVVSHDGADQLQRAVVVDAAARAVAGVIGDGGVVDDDRRAALDVDAAALGFAVVARGAGRRAGPRTTAAAGCDGGVLGDGAVGDEGVAAA